MIIDCHAHIAPPSLMAAIEKEAASFPSLRLVPDPAGGFGLSFVGGKATRPVAKPLSDIDARVKWMDGQKIERQVAGGWLDMFGYELPAEEGLRWSRLINAHLAELAKTNSRFVALATVPLQDGARAAEVLREAHAMGLPGAMIGTQPKGVGGVLDDPSLEPFWKAADELGSALFIHPVFESGDKRNADYGMANAVGRITDTLIAVSRIIYSGHILKYRNAKVVVGIGGAALPWTLGRLQKSWTLDKSLGNPAESLAALYYDTIVHDAHTLRFLADKVGAGRIMMGSDAPFPIGDMTPMDVVRDAGFTASEAASINGGLARSLFVK